nr:F-box protein At5g07610-like [Coffea arabica]
MALNHFQPPVSAVSTRWFTPPALPPAPPPRCFCFAGIALPLFSISLHSARRSFSCSRVKEFVVYNPTTREFKLIPTIDTVDCYKVLNIVFDPVKSDHYKLICICWDRSESSVYRFSVYSSEIGVWKNTGEMEIEELICERGVLWNGGLHWISHWNYSVCFDVDNECIGPHRYAIREPGKHADVWYFGESGGRLFYIDVNEPQGMLFDVFELELKRDCLYWSVKYQVDLAPLTTLYPQMLNENCSLSFEERFEFYTTSFLVDERKKKAGLVISLAGKIISYDINKLTVLELANVEVDAYYGPRRGFYRWDWASQHVKTLTCL